MTIEPLLKIFEYHSDSFQKLNREFRLAIFREAAEAKLPGFIITYAWALDYAEDKDEVDSYNSNFRKGWLARSIFLNSQQVERRIERNKTALRLSEKASKRDLDFSERNLKDSDRKYRQNTNSDSPFFYPDRHVKINNESYLQNKLQRSLFSILDLSHQVKK